MWKSPNATYKCLISCESIKDIHSLEDGTAIRVGQRHGGQFGECNQPCLPVFAAVRKRAQWAYDQSLIGDDEDATAWDDFEQRGGQELPDLRLEPQLLPDLAFQALFGLLVGLEPPARQLPFASLILQQHDPAALQNHPLARDPIAFLHPRSFHPHF